MPRSSMMSSGTVQQFYMLFFSTNRAMPRDIVGAGFECRQDCPGA
jgi:hypothetical protein